MNAVQAAPLLTLHHKLLIASSGLFVVAMAIHGYILSLGSFAAIAAAGAMPLFIASGVMAAIAAAGVLVLAIALTIKKKPAELTHAPQKIQTADLLQTTESGDDEGDLQNVEQDTSDTHTLLTYLKNAGPLFKNYLTSVNSNRALNQLKDYFSVYPALHAAIQQQCTQEAIQHQITVYLPELDAQKLLKQLQQLNDVLKQLFVAVIAPKFKSEAQLLWQSINAEMTPIFLDPLMQSTTLSHQELIKTFIETYGSFTLVGTCPIASLQYLIDCYHANENQAMLTHRASAIRAQSYKDQNFPSKDALVQSFDPLFAELVHTMCASLRFKPDGTITLKDIVEQIATIDPALLQTWSGTIKRSLIKKFIDRSQMITPHFIYLFSLMLNIISSPTAIDQKKVEEHVAIFKQLMALEHVTFPNFDQSKLWKIYQVQHQINTNRAANKENPILLIARNNTDLDGHLICTAEATLPHLEQGALAQKYKQLLAPLQAQYSEITGFTFVACQRHAEGILHIPANAVKTFIEHSKPASAWAKFKGAAISVAFYALKGRIIRHITEISQLSIYLKKISPSFIEYLLVAGKDLRYSTAHQKRSLSLFQKIKTPLQAVLSDLSNNQKMPIEQALDSINTFLNISLDIVQQEGFILKDA